MKVLTLSFRESELDMYYKIKEKSSPSAFIKDVLKQYFKNMEKVDKQDLKWYE